MEGFCVRPYLHTVHVLLAGIWLGCLVFTTLVVSPALRRMEWRESERVLVRSRIGRQFMWLANPLLALLVLFLLLDGLTAPLPVGRLVRFLIELGLVLGIAALAGSHGLIFGRRLRDLAAQEAEAPAEVALRLATARHRVQRISFSVSIVDLASSLAVAILAVNL
jgi:putative copper export protein